MAIAHKRHTARAGSRASGFRAKVGLVEKFSEERLDHFRMMALRGDFGNIIWHIQHESKTNLQYLERLLSDAGVGVAENTADVLAELAKRRINISQAVPALERALENKYVKANAAKALAAHHLHMVNIKKLEGLLRHRDPLIKASAEEIVSQERS
jgi:hypothetical protein